MPIEERLSPSVQLAREFFREHYAACFWHWRPDLIITEAMIPAVVKELFAHGGRTGMLAAARLQKLEER